LKVIDGSASRAEFEAAQAASGQLPTEIPPCPSRLTGPARVEWFRITALLARLHLVTALDRNELAVYCQAWGDWCLAREKIAEAYAADQRCEGGYVDRLPSGYRQLGVWQQMAARAETTMRQSAAHFGFTPATRARVLENARQPGLFDPTPAGDAADYFTRG